MGVKVPPIRTFNDYGLALELKVSELSEEQRVVLRRRVAEAQQRAALKAHQLSVLQLVLNSKPLPADVIKHWKEKD